MGIAELSRTTPLRFGCPIQFRDRWQGTLAGVEVADDWEILNLIIERGLFRWTQRVKLAFTNSPGWSFDSVTLDCTSTQAFAREIPPVPVRARLLARQTPMSLPDARLLGLLVEPRHRHATDVIVRRGGAKFRLPASAVSFDAQTLRLGSRGEELIPYLTDAELVDAVRHALASNSHLTGGERSALGVTASGGAVIVEGNVRTGQVKDSLRASLARFAAGAELQLEVVDDIDLELEIGRAVQRAGVQHRSEVYPRSVVGAVTLFGSAPSIAAVDEISRVVARVSGVRSVTSRMVVGAGAAREPPST